MALLERGIIHSASWELGDGCDSGRCKITENCLNCSEGAKSLTKLSCRSGAKLDSGRFQAKPALFTAFHFGRIIRTLLDCLYLPSFHTSWQ